MTIKNFIEKKIAVRTGTGENLRKFLSMCEKEGLKWQSGHNAIDFVPHAYGDECCVIFGKPSKRLTYSDSEYYKLNGYKIVDFSELPKRYQIIIECDNGKTTSATMLVNGRIVKEALTNLDPRDKFNFVTGAKVAFDRLFEKKHKKIKVGDKVTIRKGLIPGRVYGAKIFVSGMKEYTGKTLTVSEVGDKTFRCKESYGWNWTNKMVE